RYPPDAIAEADAHRAIGFAPGTKSHFVPVFEEAALFAGRQLERLLAAAADFEERAEASVAVGREGAGADEIAGLEIAAARAVMRDDLRRAPVHRRIGRSARQHERRQARFTHLPGRESHLKL